MSIFRRPHGYLHFRHPKEMGTEPSVHTTTSVVGRLRRKSAAVPDWPGLEREKPSMNFTLNVVKVKFGGSNVDWMGTRSVFL